MRKLIIVFLVGFATPSFAGENRPNWVYGGIESLSAIGSGIQTGIGVMSLYAARSSFKHPGSLAIGLALTSKSVLDLAVHLRNIGRAARGEEIIARSALGEITYLVTGNKHFARGADLADMLVGLKLGNLGVKAVVKTHKLKVASAPHPAIAEGSGTPAISIFRRMINARGFVTSRETAGWYMRTPSAIASTVSLTYSGVDALTGR